MNQYKHSLWFDGLLMGEQLLHEGHSAEFIMTISRETDGPTEYSTGIRSAVKHYMANDIPISSDHTQLADDYTIVRIK